MLCIPSQSGSIAGVSSWVLTVYVVYNYFKGITSYRDKKRIEKLEKVFNKETKIKLFQWIAITDLFGDSLYSWLREDAQKDIASNLKKIKEEIIKSVGDSIFDYYLLKDYLEYYTKNNFLYKVWKIINPVIISSFTGFLIKIVVLDKLLGYFLKSTEGKIGLEDQIELIVGVSSTMLILSLVVIYIRSELIKDKRIIDIFIMIVDIIIKQKEKEQVRELKPENEHLPDNLRVYQSTNG